jgi:hypothetical protein
VEVHRVVRRRGPHIFSRQSAHRWRWSCQPYAPASFYPQDDSWYSHFCLRLRRPQGHSATGRIRSIEKSNDIGIWIRDFPACNIVPQPTTLPRASFRFLYKSYIHRRSPATSKSVSQVLRSKPNRSNGCTDHVFTPGHSLQCAVDLAESSDRNKDCKMYVCVC